MFSWKPLQFCQLSLRSRVMGKVQSGVGWENISMKVSFKPTSCQCNIWETDYFCVMWSEIYASRMYLGDLWIIEGNFKLMVFGKVLYLNSHHQDSQVLRYKLERFNTFLVLFFSLFSTHSTNLVSPGSASNCLEKKSHTMESLKLYTLRRKILVSWIRDFSHNTLEYALFHSLEFGISKVE